MGKQAAIQRSRGPEPSEVGDKLVLRRHKQQACFLPPGDVSCRRLFRWKPGCWGGMPALETELSSTQWQQEAVTASPAGKTWHKQRRQPVGQVGAWPGVEAEHAGQEIQNPTQHIPTGP